MAPADSGCDEGIWEDLDGLFRTASALMIAAHSVCAFDWLQKPTEVNQAVLAGSYVSYVDILSERSLRRLLHNCKAFSSLTGELFEVIA